MRMIFRSGQFYVDIMGVRRSDFCQVYVDGFDVCEELVTIRSQAFDGKQKVTWGCWRASDVGIGRGGSRTSVIDKCSVLSSSCN